ncbi:MAG: transketolase [Candidatus Magasanikbacteria bacterium]|jgi:transketolase
MTATELKRIASKIRINILNLIYKTKSSHIGSCFCIVDILAVLYFKIMNINPQNIKDENRDIFILSKGHAVVALYIVLAEAGFYDFSVLDKYATDGSKLAGHVIKNSLPGIEVSSGSLGHGLSMAVGMALAAKLDNKSRKIFCLMGDGECNEGSVWEATMFAAQHKLSNLYIIVDYNNQQGMGEADKIISQNNLAERFRSFGCNSIDVDGHDIGALLGAFGGKVDTRPVVIAAKTIKGKGVSFMENNVDFHYKSPTDEQHALALKELTESV